MNKQEIDMLFQKLSLNYPKENFSDALIKEWSSVLSKYDFKDVNDNLDILLADKIFSFVPPKLMTIVKGLTPKYEKVDFNKIVYFCQFCRRPFNNINDLHSHEDRCSAIRYIEKQCLKYNLKFDNNKKIELYKMAQEEFDTNYNNFLKNIYLKSNNSYEKQLISFILNPPEREIVKEFLNNQK